MNHETVMDVLNVITSLAVFAIISYKLLFKIDKFTPAEAIGMGLLAAGCVMTIGPITYKPSPYDDWSGTLMRFGAGLYFIGRLTRHRYNNWKAKEDARRRLNERFGERRY